MNPKKPKKAESPYLDYIKEYKAKIQKEIEEQNQQNHWWQSPSKNQHWRSQSLLSQNESRLL